jgi:hypothetical protein
MPALTPVNDTATYLANLSETALATYTFDTRYGMHNAATVAAFNRYASVLRLCEAEIAKRRVAADAALLAAIKASEDFAALSFPSRWDGVEEPATVPAPCAAVFPFGTLSDALCPCGREVSYHWAAHASTLAAVGAAVDATSDDTVRLAVIAAREAAAATPDAALLAIIAKRAETDRFYRYSHNELHNTPSVGVRAEWARADGYARYAYGEPSN